MSTNSKAAIDPADFLNVDGLLDDEERAVRDVVRNYAQKELAPQVGSWYEEGTIPARELAKDFAALGLLGMHLQGYGCAGTSAVAYGLACRELEAVDSGLRSSCPCRAHWRCSPCTGGGPRSTSRNGCPRWRRGRSSGVSA